MFKHYKLKPSFPIIKNNKTKYRAGLFLIWYNFSFFHPTGHQKINQNQFDPSCASVNQFGPILSNLNQIIYLIHLDLSWSNLNQFDLSWSELIWFEPNYSSKWINGLKRPTNIKSEPKFFKSEQQQQKHDKWLEA